MSELCDGGRASIVAAIAPRAALFDAGGRRITAWYDVLPRDGVAITVPAGASLVRYGLTGRDSDRVDYLSEQLPPVEPGDRVRVKLDQLARRPVPA